MSCANIWGHIILGGSQDQNLREGQKVPFHRKGRIKLSPKANWKEHSSIQFITPRDHFKMGRVTCVSALVRHHHHQTPSLAQQLSAHYYVL